MLPRGRRPDDTLDPAIPVGYLYTIATGTDCATRRARRASRRPLDPLRARGVGGCRLINAMIYIARAEGGLGTTGAAIGNRGWAWEDSPVFKGLEDYEHGATPTARRGWARCGSKTRACEGTSSERWREAPPSCRPSRRLKVFNRRRQLRLAPTPDEPEEERPALGATNALVRP